MAESWKVAITVCWAATFIALLADEITEHVATGSTVFIISLVAFGISMAVAFIAGCIAAAALFSSRRKKPL